MSPIEARLLDAIRRVVASQNINLTDYTMYPSIAALAIDHWLIGVEPNEPDPDEYGADLGEPRELVEQWSIYADVPLLTYRADFVLESEYGRVVIECDGHDYHDRTKQQAAYDRARDRELLLTGLVTIRYTGSEIHHSAERCALEAIKVAHLLGDKALAEWKGRR